MTTSPLALTRRARRIQRALAAGYPDAHCALNFTNAYELLVATILSAQCTDARVNMVTPTLFAAYPTPADLAVARQEDVENIIHSTGFYRNKAKNLVALGNALVEQHQGQVPGSLDELVKLPGVGRKTANVVLGNVFGVPGITVDTHCGRLARRLELTTNEDPVAVEKDLMALLVKKGWTAFSHQVIQHGRQVCHSRKAACGACFLASMCPGFGTFGPTDPDTARALVTGEDAQRVIELALEAPEEIGRKS